MIRAAVLENQFEVELVSQILDEEKVDFVLKTFHDTAFDGIFEAGKGFAWVMAGEESKEIIERIVRQVRESKPIFEDGENDDGGENAGEE